MYFFHGGSSSFTVNSLKPVSCLLWSASCHLSPVRTSTCNLAATSSAPRLADSAVVNHILESCCSSLKITLTLNSLVLLIFTLIWILIVLCLFLQFNQWWKFKFKLTVWIRCGPSLVFAAGRPNSNFLFLRMGFLFPPVALRLCQWSREIPTMQYREAT